MRRFLFSTLKIKKIAAVLAVVFFYIIISGVTQAHDDTKTINTSTEAYDVSELSRLTKELFDQNNSYKTNSVSISLLKETALARKNELSRLAKNNPKSFLENTTLLANRSEFPKEIQEYIENEIEIQGKLQVIHVDSDFTEPNNTKHSHNRYVINKEEKTYELYFTNESPELLSDTEVKLKGINLDSNIVLETGDIATSFNSKYKLEVLNNPILIDPLGEQKYLVVLVNFDNNRSQPISVDGARSVLFGESNSVNSYFKENSYNKTTLIGDVYGWVTLDPADNYTDTCAVTQWKQKADIKVAALGVNVNSYNRFLYIFPNENIYCNSQANVGGNPSSVWMFTNHTIPNVYAHEIGHNFGLNHANAMYCGSDKTIDAYENCNTVEYGDGFAIMGGINGAPNNMHHFTGLHKAALGWVNEKVVNTSGIFTIAPIEENSNADKVLKIKKEDTDDFYYLSYKQPIGSDSGLPSFTTSGATLYLRKGTSYFPASIVLDAEPASSYNSNAFTDNQVFYDQVNRLKITQLSHNIQGVTLKVEIEPLSSSSLIGQWSSTESLPTPLYFHSVVSVKGYVFNIGQEDSEADFTKVYSAQISNNGIINPWTVSNPIPNALVSSRSVAHGDSIYTIGGYNESDESIVSIYKTRVNDDGSLQDWEIISEFPQGITGHSVSVNGNKIYVIGGITGSHSNKVYMNTFDSQGGLGVWSETAGLPVPLYAATSVVYGNRIYLLSGNLSSGARSTVIYYADFNSDGTLSTWQVSNKTLPKGLGSLTANIFNSRLIISGGVTGNGEIQNIIYSNNISNDGSLTDWKVDNLLPTKLYAHQSLVSNNHVYVFGGVSKSDTSPFIPQNAVYTAPLQLSDLVIEEILRDEFSYKVTYCNRGNISSETSIKLRLENTSNAVTYDRSIILPQPNQCQTIEDISCNLLASDCNDNIEIKANIDADDLVDEYYENNNELIQEFKTLYTDLVAKDLIRENGYYKFNICNEGEWQSKSKFVYKLTNLKNNISYPTEGTRLVYTEVPKPGECSLIQNILCSALGNKDCNDTVDIKIDIDIKNTIEESDETNNSLVVAFVAQVVDLTIEQVSRDRSYYKVYMCNLGNIISSSKFTIKLTNINTGKSFVSNYLYPYSVPQPGQCQWSGGFTCGLIGSNCTDNINIKAEVDNGNTVSESNESNNSREQNFTSRTSIY